MDKTLEHTDAIGNFVARYARSRDEELSLDEYLAVCKRNPLAYATAAERMLTAIGEPQVLDTRSDPRLSRIFANKLIKIYPAFSEFYGMEEAIEQVVSYFRHAAQGLEERKQIQYLLGPVGGGKSSLAERLKHLMQQVPFYAIKGSPVNESPQGLFDAVEDGPILRDNFGIAKTEPGDESNQDISTLVGKVDIRKLESFSQDDPDAYSFSGGLCLANQGLLEFVEMFKAPIKVLHPLLTAT